MDQERKFLFNIGLKIMIYGKELYRILKILNHDDIRWHEG